MGRAGYASRLTFPKRQFTLAHGLEKVRACRGDFAFQQANRERGLDARYDPDSAAVMRLCASGPLVTCTSTMQAVHRHHVHEAGDLKQADFAAQKVGNTWLRDNEVEPPGFRPACRMCCSSAIISVERSRASRLGLNRPPTAQKLRWCRELSFKAHRFGRNSVAKLIEVLRFGVGMAIPYLLTF
jgi:hypothetical protein